MQNESPMVSVVMCCYNSEQYIRETIESVLNQTYSNFEFIIWNDGSTDSTEEIIKSYSDNRIRYFYHKNTGVGVARKLANSNAKGKYIAIIDSDDICFPSRIEKEFLFLENHRDYVIVSSQMIYIGEDGVELGYSYSVLSDFVIRRKMKNSSVISHPACMYNRAIYNKVGGYSGIVLGEDHLLFSKMMKYGKAYNLPYPLIKYRIRSMSLMHSIEGNKYLPVLDAYRKKMVGDTLISDADVRIYNNIYLRGKKEMEVAPLLSTHVKVARKSIEDMLYSILKTFLGCSYSMRTTIAIKNYLHYIVYKILF